MNNSSVFVRKPSVSNKVIGTPVASYYGHRIKTGTVGIEIELEGANFPKEDEELPDEWQYHEDHSLRGEDNAEYVLRLPESFATAEDAVRRLFCVLDDNCVVIDDSPRTSVHVHLNFQKNCVNRIAAFSALFFTVEEILSEWCGDHRAGNLFCLRAKDAPAISALAKEIVSNNLGVSISSDYHYAGLNFESLQKFGSLEVRHRRGPKDAQEVIDWLKIVQRIYDMSDVFKSDPREICYKYSYEGPSRFFKDVFGPDLYPVVLAGLSEEWNEQKINDSVREGIRIAQDICFCVNWNAFEEPKEDPFGRTAKAAPVVSSTQAVYDEYANINPIAESYIDYPTNTMPTATNPSVALQNWESIFQSTS